MFLKTFHFFSIWKSYPESARLSPLVLSILHELLLLNLFLLSTTFNHALPFQAPATHIEALSRPSIYQPKTVHNVGDEHDGRLRLRPIVNRK